MRHCEAEVGAGPALCFVPWHFEQSLREAVFVLAGFPRQVRGGG